MRKPLLQSPSDAENGLWKVASTIPSAIEVKVSSTSMRPLSGLCSMAPLLGPWILLSDRTVKPEKRIDRAPVWPPLNKAPINATEPGSTSPLNFRVLS